MELQNDFLFALDHAGYAALHNQREQRGLNDGFALLLKSLSLDWEPDNPDIRPIAFTPDQGTAYLKF